MEKRKKYYKVGETVWIKTEKIKATIKVLDKENYNATIEVDGVERVVKFWEITKYQLPKKETTVDQNTPKKQSSKKRSDPLTIIVKHFGGDEVEKIEKIPQGDWIDLRATETVVMKAFDFVFIPLNVAMQLPKGYEAYVLPRSSTYKNFKIILANSQGVIDNSFSGDGDQWKFPAIALQDTVINKGDRICQFRIQRIMPTAHVKYVERLGNADRGGFGITGVK